MARGWRAWVLCIALGLAAAARAAVERSVGEVSVQFPGPAERIELVQYDSPSPATRWKQEAPTPADPDRVLVLNTEGVPLPWWTRWLIRQGPEAMLLRMSESLESSMTATYNAAGGADADTELVHINGHPALRISVDRRDTAHPIMRPDGQPALLASRAHTMTLFLWTGDSLVMAAVAGSQPVTEDDPFLRSITTRTPGVPGDPDAQSEYLCRLGNIVIGSLLILLVVGFIALVYAIDKTLKRRRRARRACLPQTAPATDPARLR